MADIEKQVLLFDFKALVFLGESDLEGELSPGVSDEIETTIFNGLKGLRTRRALAREIEHMLSDILGYHAIVEVKFRKGSIEIIGTILLAAVGGIVWEATKAESQKILQFVMKNILERVLPRWLKNYEAIVPQVEISQSADKPPDKVTTKEPFSVQQKQLALQVPAQKMLRYLTLLTIANTVLLILLVVLLLLLHLRYIP